MMQLTTIILQAWLFGAINALPTAERTQTCGSTFSSIVVFGDSFSDNGNGSFKICNGSWPPTQYYYEGRFSNGPVWIELVAQNLSLPLYDYAVGGSTSSNKLVQGYTGNGSTIPAPSTDEQVDKFLANAPEIDLQSSLIVVSGGANDLFFQPNLSAYQSKDVLAQQVKKLQKVGAKHFLFFNYYDTSMIPYDTYATVENKEQNRKWSIDFGNALKGLHKEVPGSVYYDLASELFPKLYFYGEPTSFGLDPFGAYGSCVVGTYRETPTITVCDKPDTKVFWDEYHPTRVTHRLFAQGVLDRLAAH